MTVIDADQNMEQQLTLARAPRSHIPGKIKTLSRRTLIELAMVKSDNRAAQTLCEHYPGGLSSCVTAMNAKLKTLGMMQSVVYEPTGLDPRTCAVGSCRKKLWGHN
jgi:D-alanyl-D-alanine carboxypeptidase